MRIKLRERFGESLMGSEDGERAASEARAAFELGEHVVLDFEGVRTLLTAFVNPIVGELYGNHAADVVDGRLRAENANPLQEKIFRRARDHARRFYNDVAYREAQDASARELFAG